MLIIYAKSINTSTFRIICYWNHLHKYNQPLGLDCYKLNLNFNHSKIHLMFLTYTLVKILQIASKSRVYNKKVGLTQL